MALVTQFTTCPLCGELLGNAKIVATSHFISDPEDPLWRYSDAAMHYGCFQKWSLREAFVDKYNSTVGQRASGNGTWYRMHPNGKIGRIRKGE